MGISHKLQLHSSIAIIMLIALGLGGCISYDRFMQTWVGKTESELIKDWGKPDMTNTFDNGETIHTWIRSETSQSGPYTCQKSVTVNHAHTITKGTSRGCPSVAVYRH